MVDNPLIPPTSRNVVSQNIQKPTSVTPDPKVSKVSIDKGLVQRSLVENKELDSVKLSEKVPTVPEETIPLPILASEELQGAEWAWRRVIFQTIMSMLAKGQQSDVSSPTEVSPRAATTPERLDEEASTQPSNAGQQAVGNELPASRSTNSPVTGVNQPQADATVEVRAAQPQSVAQTSGERQVAAQHNQDQQFSGQSPNGTIYGSSSLSGPFSSSVAGTMNGRTSNAAPMDGNYQGASPAEIGGDAAQLNNQAEAAGIHETQNNAMKLLWNTLVKYGAGESAQVWKLDWAVSDLQGKVVPFSNFKMDHLDKLPARVKDWIVADRLLASTNQSNPKITGEGLYFTVPRNAENRKSAVRWKAERQTKLTSTHALVHRLAIEVQVGTSPVKVTMVASEPTILVHIATNDMTLRKTFQDTLDRVQKSIQGLGWTVDRATVGPLTDVEESL